jgi:hypothetical protein
VLVRTGGKIFEIYITVSGKYSNRRRLRTRNGVVGIEGEDLLDADEEAAMVATDGPPFYIATLMSVNNRSQNASRHIFEFSLYLKYLGLSVTGLDVTARFALTTSRTSFRRLIGEALVSVEEDLR